MFILNWLFVLKKLKNDKDGLEPGSQAWQPCHTLLRHHPNYLSTWESENKHALQT